MSEPPKDAVVIGDESFRYGQVRWVEPSRMVHHIHECTCGACSCFQLDELPNGAALSEAMKSCERIRFEEFDGSRGVLARVEVDSSLQTIAGLFGSLQETFAIAIACEAEVRAWRAVQTPNPEPMRDVGERFFIEAELQHTISAAHRLANIVARLLVARADWRQQFIAAGHAPKKLRDYLGEEPKRDQTWISLTKFSVKGLSDWAQIADHTTATQATEILDRLISSEAWAAANGTRGAQHHRWREESPVFAGIDGQSGYRTRVYDEQGHVIGSALRASPKRYEPALKTKPTEVSEARGSSPEHKRSGSQFIADLELITLAGSAAVARAAVDIARLWPAILEPIARGSIYRNRTGEPVNSAWSDATCGCCDLPPR